VTGWLRRNRWGLLALPATVVLAAGANAQRVQDFWWKNDLRHAAATAVPGEWVTWTDDFDDSAGRGTRSLRVKLTAAGPVAGPADVGLPSDLTPWQVTMHFEAAPDQVLYGCLLALRDAGGNRYEYRSTADSLGQDDWPCLPGQRVGPRPALTPGRPRAATPGEDRPPDWTTRPVVLVPRSARITEVLMWWEEPDHLVVRVN
jgi:hypothetical protein